MVGSSVLLMVANGRSLLAQASPTPKPTLSPTVDAATIEFLKGQFSSLTTSFNIYVTLLSLVTALFVGVAAWLFNKTLKEARQDVDQLVKVEVRREISKSIKSRVDLLEQVLQQEAVPGLVTVDYVLQQSSRTLPQEYQLLNARFPRTKVRKLDSRKFDADVVVLDMVNYQPTGTKLEEAELDSVLKDIVDKMDPDSVLAVYAPRRYDAIDDLRPKVKYYTSANIPIQLLGNVINCAYVASTLRGENS